MALLLDEDDSQYASRRLRCRVCQSRRLRLNENGFLECPVCNTQSQDYLSQEMEIEDVSQRKVRLRVKSDTQSAVAETFSSDRLVFLKALHEVLLLQATALIDKFGAPEALRPHMMGIWGAFVDEFVQAEDPSKISVPSLPMLQHTLAICFLSARCLGLPVCIEDVQFMARQDILPYFSVALQVEALQKFTAIMALHLKPVFSTPGHLRELVDLVAARTGCFVMPVPRIDSFIARYSTELQLPPRICHLARQLEVVYPITSLRKSPVHYIHKRTLPHEYAMAYIVIALKLLHGYNGSEGEDGLPPLTLEGPLGIPAELFQPEMTAPVTPENAAVGNGSGKYLKFCHDLFVSHSEFGREKLRFCKELRSIGRMVESTTGSSAKNSAPAWTATSGSLRLADLAGPLEDLNDENMQECTALLRKYSKYTNRGLGSWHRPYEDLLEQLAPRCFTSVEALHGAVFNLDSLMFGEPKVLATADARALRSKPIIMGQQGRTCPHCNRVFSLPINFLLHFKGGCKSCKRSMTLKGKYMSVTPKSQLATRGDSLESGDDTDADAALAHTGASGRALQEDDTQMTQMVTADDSATPVASGRAGLRKRAPVAGAKSPASPAAVQPTGRRQAFGGEDADADADADAGDNVDHLADYRDLCDGFDSDATIDLFPASQP